MCAVNTLIDLPIASIENQVYTTTLYKKSFQVIVVLLNELAVVKNYKFEAGWCVMKI